MGKSKHSPDKAKARESEVKALALRKLGMTYEQIAKALDISETSARRAIARAFARLEQISAESAEEMRRLESERLDALWVPAFKKAKAGDLLAMDRALRIHTARVKLWGLEIQPAPTLQADLPQSITIKFQDDDIDA